MILLVGAAVALVLWVRLRFADVPLERDEGEYAYAGQLILDGVPPYTLAYNMKFPGTYYAYAALMSVFGQTPAGIRLGLLIINIACIALVFAIGRRLAGTLVGGVAAITFAMLSIDRWTMGPFAHATHFLLLPALIGWLLLERALRSDRTSWLIAAGASFGLAITMKQQALPFAGVAVLLALPAWKRAMFVAVGVVATLLAMVLVLAMAGVLDKFWFWTFQYAAAYVSEIPLSTAGAVLQMALTYITQATGWFWYAAILGLVLLVFTQWPAATRKTLLAWFVASAAAVVPGFFFRPHYFVLLMPVAAILTGIGIASIDRALARGLGAATARVVALLLVMGLGASYLIRDGHYLFRMGETELMRSLYADNPFLESPEIGRYIAAHTKPGDRIAVLGSEPQIYFYAKRPSATGYIYTYPMMEPQPYAKQMASEFKQEVEAAKPLYLVLSGIRSSWGIRPDSDMSILAWAGEYAPRCYDLAGVAEMNPRGLSKVLWDDAVLGYQPRSQSQVMIYRRKPGAC